MAGVWQKIALGLGVVGLCLFGIPIKVKKNCDVETENLFKSYIVKFNKTYGENDTEYKMRLKNFQTSLKVIEELNAARTSNTSAIYGVTKFSDLAAEEFQTIHLQPKLHTRLKLGKSPHNHHHRMYHRHSNSIHKRAVTDSLPMTVDWRESKVVGAVRNQKDCGACWAFSTVETAESMYAIKKGVLQTLSVQELIDCAGNGNLGCAGGDTCSLLEWLVSKKVVIELEESYPLALKTQKCMLKSAKGVGIQIADNFTCEYLVDAEDVMLNLLAHHGPLVTAVNALNWQNYLGGIIQFHCDGAPEHINHAVQIVGYDRSGPVPYYILRNSWGEEFGDKGYLYVAIGKNICGLATEVSSLDVI